jgi:Cu(I)/Ag(I) efflux system membrane fusion protein
MTVEPRAARALPSLLIGLAIGLALGAGALYAHVSGRLTPIYHALGLHFMHSTSEEQQQNAGQAMPGHAGHGGMHMPPAQGTGEPSQIPGYATVTLAPERQQLIGVRKGKVVRDRLLMSIRAVGIIEPDQTRLSRPQVRISGWVTAVHANFVGQDVKKGDPLLEVYSPDLLATQEEYLIAMEGGQKPLADSARRRLELWGVPADEIKELVKTKKPRDTLVLRADIDGRVLERNVYKGMRVEPTTELYRIADLSVVLLQAKVYQYEVPHIELGQPVRVTLLSQPETEFQGKVSFVEPVLKETTRTVNVRVELDNPKDLFKPGMYANLLIEHDMGEGVLIPESGMLQTGDRALAFRILPDNRFEPVEVKLGSRFGERWQVLSGLSEGDKIVASAVFLIDAESRLKSAASAFGGHQHGASAGPAAKSTGSPEMKSGEKQKGAGHEHHGHESKGATETKKADADHEHRHDGKGRP